jgi:hypothetical protein
VLSPELVLVSPELRVTALAALPERPWEVFLPPPPPPETLVVPKPRPVVVEAPILPPVAAQAPKSNRARYVALLAAGLMAGFVAAQLAQLSGGNSAPVSTVAQPPAPAPTIPPVPSSASIPVARGGYVFGRSGRFLVAGDLSRVRSFQAQVRCAGRISIPAIRLRQSRFGYSDRVRVRRQAVQVKVVGHFLDRDTARGYVRASSRRCDSGKVPFVARLS